MRWVGSQAWQPATVHLYAGDAKPVGSFENVIHGEQGSFLPCRETQALEQQFSTCICNPEWIFPARWGRCPSCFLPAPQLRKEEKLRTGDSRIAASNCCRSCFRRKNAGNCEKAAERILTNLQLLKFSGQSEENENGRLLQPRRVFKAQNSSASLRPVV